MPRLSGGIPQWLWVAMPRSVPNWFGNSAAAHFAPGFQLHARMQKRKIESEYLFTSVAVQKVKITISRQSQPDQSDQGIQTPWRALFAVLLKPGGVSMLLLLCVLEIG